MIINSSSLTGISSIFCTTPNRRHLRFSTGGLTPGSLLSNDGYDAVFSGESYSYHGGGLWKGWCENYGQVAGSVVLRGGTSIDLAVAETGYGSFASTGGTMTLIDITATMSYHAGGDNTVASQVYNFRAYNRILYNSAGNPAVARNTYYGNGSGSSALDASNFRIVVVSSVPYFRFTPASSNTATTTKITFFGQVVQSV